MGLDLFDQGRPTSGAVRRRCWDRSTIACFKVDSRWNRAKRPLSDFQSLLIFC